MYRLAAEFLLEHFILVHVIEITLKSVATGSLHKLNASPRFFWGKPPLALGSSPIYFYLIAISNIFTIFQTFLCFLVQGYL